MKTDQSQYFLFLVLTLGMVFPTACQSPDTSLENAPVGLEQLNATLWSQSAGEDRALTKAIYQTARPQLQKALNDSSWSAALEQQEDASDKPPAIILDVDETVLDNTPYQARLIRKNKQFGPETWHKWCREAQAEPIPGALEFTNYAADQGVTVFYVTNRSHKVDEATRKNLQKQGFPFPEEDKHVVLTKGERENWDGTKTHRRKYVARNHRVLLLFGDNLGDFVVDEAEHNNERIEAVRQHEEKWGKKWFVLPNPMYGEWESLPYGGDYSLDITKKRRMKIDALDAKSK